MSSEADPTDLPANIKKLLRQLEFSAQKVDGQLTRYIHVSGTMPRYPYPVWLKVTEQPKNRDRLRQINQVVWTQSLQDAVPKNAKFRIAPILDSGVMDETDFWLLMPLVNGQPFAAFGAGSDLTIIKAQHPEQYFEAIAELIRFINRTPASSLHGVDERVSGQGRKDKLSLLESMIGYARGYTPHLAELLQIVNKNYHNLRHCASHNDLTEINLMIDEQNHPVLLDAELGEHYNYRHYDATEFHNRLYTRAGRPDLAKKFLQAYTYGLPKQSRTKFLNNFLCLSAMRCIGNFYEIVEHLPVKNQPKRLKLAREYAEEIVQYKLIKGIS